VNWAFIGIGIAVILALLTALVGPLFVDWTAYRTTFEREASRLVGQPITVLGTADARVLPMPRVIFEDVIVGPPDAPLAKVGRLELAIELVPLLKGDIEVAELSITRAAVKLTINEAGALDWAGATGGITDGRLELDRIAISSADIVESRFEIEDRRSGRTVSVDRVAASLQAGSLNGPYRLDGTGQMAGEFVSFKLATGRRDPAGQFPLKLALTPSERPLQISFDGKAGVADGALRLGGALQIARLAEPPAKGDKATDTSLPWRVSATIDVGAKAIDASEVTVAIGHEERAYLLTGAARLPLTPRAELEAKLSARQIDLDRALSTPDPARAASPVGATIAPSAAIKLAATTAAALGEPPVPMALTVELPGVVVGGSVVQDVELAVRSRPDGWRIERARATLPGQSDVSVEGVLTFHPDAPVFLGDARMLSQTPGALAAWLGVPAERGSVEMLTAEAKLSAGATGYSLDQLKIELGEATWIGRIAAGEILSVALAADRASLDDLTTYARLIAGGSGSGGSVVFDLSVDEIDARGIAGRGLVVKAGLMDGTLQVDAVSLADLGGARLAAKGEVRDLSTAPSGSLDATLEATSLEGIARGLSIVWPNSALARHVTAIASTLVPAKLAIDFTAEPSGAGVDAQTKAKLALSGSLGATGVNASAEFTGRPDRWHAGAATADVVLEGPDAGVLLTQLGWPRVAGSGRLTGRVEARLSGTPERGMVARAVADLGPTKLEAQGKLRLSADGSRGGEVALALKSHDASPLALMLGRPLPGLGGALPVDLTARVVADGPRARIEALAGTVDGQPINGALTVDGAVLPTRVSGTLETGAIDLKTLFEFTFGAGAFGTGLELDGTWADTAFGAGAVDGLDVRLTMRSRALDVMDGLSIQQATYDLRLTEREAAVEKLKGQVAGGALTADARMTRAVTGEATLEADISLTGAAVEEFAWRRAGSSVLSGSLDTRLRLESGGRTFAALIAGLAGGGALTLTKGTARGLTTDAFDLVRRAADAGLPLDNERIRTAFESHLDAGSLPFGRLEGALTLAGGVVRLRDLTVDAGAAATVSGSAALDLARLTLQADTTIRVTPDKDDQVAGAAPQVAVAFAGPVDQPRRSVDVAPFTAYLTIRAFEREVRRVEALQEEIIERDRFARELRRLREERQRREREEAERLERERVEFEIEGRRFREAAEARRVQARREQQEAARRQAAERTRTTPTPTFEGLIRDALDSRGSLTPAPAAPLRLQPLPPPVQVPAAPPVIEAR
jgi:uncharacterized protein involved in outer membrane biogenesis